MNSLLLLLIMIMMLIMVTKNDHRLRGAASTVLPTTGQVSRRWQILTPYRITTLNRLPQNSAQLITSARGPPKPNLVQIHARGNG